MSAYGPTRTRSIKLAASQEEQPPEDPIITKFKALKMNFDALYDNNDDYMIDDRTFRIGCN